MGVDKTTSVADRGYYGSEDILARYEAGVTIFVPRTVILMATLGKGRLHLQRKDDRKSAPRGARLEHEAVLEKMQTRLDHAPEMTRARRQTVEHPRGTIRTWIGATHSLTRMIERVRTETRLHVLAYIKRVIA